MAYYPRRAAARWLQNAPAGVLACYDAGPAFIDRYTVLYGAPLWSPAMGRVVPARIANAAPFHPMGIGLYDELPTHNRSAFGKQVRFVDLPPDLQQLVRQDCAEGVVEKAA